MSTTVVMVTYYTGPALFHAISRVLAQQGLAELILVDNGNPAGVTAHLAEIAAADGRIRLLAGHGNIGFAAACNLGAKDARGEYLLLLNPDCLLAPDALRLTAEALEQTGAMLAGAHLLNADGSEQRGGRRQLLTPMTALSEILGLHRFFGTKRLNEHETPMPAAPHAVPAISGAYMFMRIKDFHALGGMDEGYFLHVEDLDLCLRVQRAGGKTICVPQARAVHLLSTSDAPSPFVEWSKAKGFIYYFDKHFAGTPAPILWGVKAGAIARYAFRMQRNRMYRSRLTTSALAGKKTLLLLESMRLPALPLKQTSVLVTGASSALGLRVSGMLLAAGAQVHALSRKPDMALEVQGLTWHRAEMERGSLPEIHAAACIHCAPLWTLPPALDALIQRGVSRIVAFGSTSIFGKQYSPDAAEQRTVARLRQAEEEIARRCAEFGVAFTLLRPTMIYGAGLDGNVTRLARFIRRWRFLPLVPPAHGLRQPVHVDDLAQAALTVLSSEETEGKSYNTVGGETLTYRAMAERIFAAVGQRPHFLPLPFLPAVLDALARVATTSRVNGEMARRMNRDLIFSHEEAARDFGYSPRRFLAGGLKDIEGL